VFWVISVYFNIRNTLPKFFTFLPGHPVYMAEVLALHTHTRTLLVLSNGGGLDGQGVWHVWGRTEIHTGFWWRSLKEGDHLEDLDIDGSMLLKLIFDN
jgi:hypothetical protein